MTAIAPMTPIISIRERYRDVVSDRWPGSAVPQPEELLSSWLHRLAYANGVAPRAFARVLGMAPGMWSASLDLGLPTNIESQLCANTNISSNQLSAMMLSQDLPKPLLLPLRNSGRRDRSTWLQFCSRCLSEDAAPYFRRRWRSASRIACTKHGCRLRDRCPSCRSRIAGFDQRELVPQHCCSRCGYDLRRASVVVVSPGAQWFDRCIDEICRPEAPVGSPPGRALFQRLLNLPSLVGLYSPRLLTSLSTAARTRCVEKLTRPLTDWLMDHDDVTVDQRPHLNAPAGARIELLAAALARKRGRPIARRGQEPAVDPAKLFRAYAQTVGMFSISSGPT